MEPDPYKRPRFLEILLIFRVPTAAARARQVRRGPSTRPCLKVTPKWSRMHIKPSVCLIFCSFQVVPTAPAQGPGPGFELINPCLAIHSLGLDPKKCLIWRESQNIT